MKEEVLQAANCSVEKRSPSDLWCVPLGANESKSRRCSPTRPRPSCLCVQLSWGGNSPNYCNCPKSSVIKYILLAGSLWEQKGRDTPYFKLYLLLFCFTAKSKLIIKQGFNKLCYMQSYALSFFFRNKQGKTLKICTFFKDLLSQSLKIL